MCPLYTYLGIISGVRLAGRSLTFAVLRWGIRRTSVLLRKIIVAKQAFDLDLHKLYRESGWQAAH